LEKDREKEREFGEREKDRERGRELRPGAELGTKRERRLRASGYFPEPLNPRLKRASSN
jgi:hypothetical protein